MFEEYLLHLARMTRKRVVSPVDGGGGGDIDENAAANAAADEDGDHDD